METTSIDSLTCECGSRKVCICYSTLVFAYLEDRSVTGVVVADEETDFSAVVRCLACERFWILEEEPEVGIWPAWQIGQ